MIFSHKNTVKYSSIRFDTCPLGQESIIMNAKGILGAIVSIILYLVFAIIYFIILGFIVKIGVDIVGAGEVSANALAIATAILTAGTIIAGGSGMNIFVKDE